MKVLIVLPVLIPLGTATVLLLTRRWRLWQRLLSSAGAGGLLITALFILNKVWREGVQAVQIGNWPAPFGITLVIDMLSAIMLVLAGLIGLAVILYSLDRLAERRYSFEYLPLLHFLLMGVCGAFITGDIFNLYVCFEVMLIASFVLLGLRGRRRQMEGAIKYVSLNLVSSAMFLTAVGIVYGQMGTLNMAALAQMLNDAPQTVSMRSAAMLFLFAFGIKAALFPLFFWLPASYHTPAAAVSAIFAGLLTKVGVYALIRFFTLLFVQDPEFSHALIVVLAGFTMVTGVLGALAQDEFRRILSFHIISQVGYMVLGLGLFSGLGLAGTVYYVTHHIIVKTNLFLISGLAHRIQGTYELKHMGNLYRTHPGLSMLFMISALSLAGLPPLSGFVAKFTLFKAGLELEQYGIVAIAMGVSILTLVSMTKIWNEAFWKPLSDLPESPGEGRVSVRAHPWMLIPIAGLAMMTVLLGLGADVFFGLANRAAEQLSNPSEYTHAVLGGW